MFSANVITVITTVMVPSFANPRIAILCETKHTVAERRLGRQPFGWEKGFVKPPTFVVGKTLAERSFGFEQPELLTKYPKTFVLCVQSKFITQFPNLARSRRKPCSHLPTWTVF
jgi:hypothetical protein